MKILKIIIQVILILLIIIAVVGWFLPSKVEMYRETTINAPAEQVYSVLNDMKKMNLWSPWYRIDPEGTSYTFEGSDSGVGAKMSWTSEHKDVGSGSQEIIESKEPTMVKTKMIFDGFDNPAYASFIINEFEGTSEVTWNFEGDFGSNPFYHYFTLFMDDMLGPQYEEGLANLKEVVEAMPVEEEELDMEIIESDSTEVAEAL